MNGVAAFFIASFLQVVKAVRHFASAHLSASSAFSARDNFRAVKVMLAESAENAE
jgi:hypothetical protein